MESEKITMAEAALMHIGTFSMGAIRKTRLEIGESALVMGLGILGLFAVQLLRAAGAAPIIAVDPVKERRDIALNLGADYVFDPTEEEFVGKVRHAESGAGLHGQIRKSGAVGLHQGIRLHSGLLPEGARTGNHADRGSYAGQANGRIPSGLVYPAG